MQTICLTRPPFAQHSSYRHWEGKKSFSMRKFLILILSVYKLFAQLFQNIPRSRLKRLSLFKALDSVPISIDVEVGKFGAPSHIRDSKDARSIVVGSGDVSTHALPERRILSIRLSRLVELQSLCEGSFCVLRSPRNRFELPLYGLLVLRCLCIGGRHGIKSKKGGIR